MGYGSGPPRDTGGKTVQDLMKSNIHDSLMAAETFTRSRAMSVQGPRASLGAARGGLNPSMSRKRVFGTRHDFAPSISVNSERMFQTTAQLHYAPRRLHDSLAEAEARVQARQAQWDAEAQRNIRESALMKKATLATLRKAKSFEKPLGGTLAQGGRVGKDPFSLRPSATYPRYESTTNTAYRHWQNAAREEQQVIDQPPGLYPLPAPFPTVFGVPAGEPCMLDRARKMPTINPREMSSGADKLARHAGPVTRSCGNFYMR